MTQDASTEQADEAKTNATPARKPSVRRGVQQAKLDALGIDELCEMIGEDLSYAAIAQRLQMSASTLSNWIEADPERSTRVREARVKSATRCDELALEALQQISEDYTTAEVARQKEIASHYRWRAKIRNPHEYGDSSKAQALPKANKTLEQIEHEIAALLEKR